MKWYFALALLLLVFGTSCENTNASSFREAIQNFAKRVFPFGQTQEVSEGNATTADGMNTTSYHVNHTSSPEEPTSSLSEKEILQLKNTCPELREEPNIVGYRYNAEKNVCQRLGWRQNCGKNMIFFLKRGIYGECGCKDSPRLVVSHIEGNECHEIFKQGFCPKGQWVDITSELVTVCRDNPCTSSGSSSNRDLVLVNGKCVEVGKREDCPVDMVVGFRWATRKPQCIPDIGAAVGVGSVKCPSGTFRGHNMKCVPPIDLDDFDY